MKKILILISIVAFAASCTLEEKVISSSTPDTYYKTVVQCKTGLNGCYLPLESMYRSGDFFEVCEAASDLIYHSYTTYWDAVCDYDPTTPRYGNTIWNQCYKGVMRCNAVYAAIERSPLTDEEKAPLFAECVILRAYYYYLLTISFGDVPYYFDEVTDANNNIIAQLPRMSAVELRNILMEELWYWIAPKTEVTADGRACQQALPYIKTYDPLNNYRIGAMVGCVIGGKLAMWNRDWDKAIAFFRYIEDVYGYVDADSVAGDTSSDTSEEEGGSSSSTGKAGYKPINALLGYKLADIRFSRRYTGESIFELPGYAKEYGLRVTHGLASRCMPPRSTVDAEEEADEYDDTIDLSQKDDMYNGIRIPELGGEARITTPYRPTKYFYQQLMPYNGSKDPEGKADRRRSTYDPANFSYDVINEVEDGGGYLAWCYSGWTKTENMNTVPRHMEWFSSPGSATGRPFLGDKFWCPGMIYSQDSNNLKIFRFAHVILDLAEAHMRMGDFTKACEYLNATKVRAGITPLTPGDEATFMDELMKESARELFGEFTRRHNLVRWGVWVEQVTQYSDNSTLRTNVATYPCLQYYPIPDEQIILSNYALDNKEYAKYGL